MDVTDDMIANIPPENLRIPGEAFGALWREAEYRGERPATTGAGNHYLTGMIVTCRWLYAQPLPHPLTPGRRLAPAEAPYTCHRDGVTPETVDAEYLTVLSVGPDRHPHRVQWAAGTAAVLGWTWHGQQRPGLDGPATAATG